MQKANFDRSKLLILQWQMVEQLASGFPEKGAEGRLGDELKYWVRWYRLPGLWLAYLFQLLTQQRRSPNHILACLLYSEAQANFNHDLAYPSMENGYLVVLRLKAAGISGLEAMERNLRGRLKSYYDFYYNLSQPKDYMEVDPLNCHLYNIVVFRNFRQAFPAVGDPTRQPGPNALRALIDQCTDLDRLYYRVLGRRFLANHYEEKHAYAEAITEYELALRDAIPVRLETEIGHLHRNCAAALLRAGRREEAVAHLKRACAHEAHPDFAYWRALSAYKLGDALMPSGSGEADPSRPGAGWRVEINLDRDRRILQKALDAYREGRIMFEAGLASPVPVARAVKQQLFRSFHANAMMAAQHLGDARNLIAELEAGGPRQAAELVAEIEACKSATPDAVREFRRVRALFFSDLSTVPGDFGQYCQKLLETNADRQRFMKSYVSLETQITMAQMSDPVAEQVLKLRLPGLAFMLFNVGWNDSNVILVDMENGRVVASAIARYGYNDLEAVHQRYREGLARAEKSHVRREPLFRTTLENLLVDYQEILGPIIENLLPFLKSRHLVIFPRAQLNAVPLHALQAEGKFLLEHFTISYSQTLGLFLKTHVRSAATPSASKVMTVYNDRGLPFYEGVLARLDQPDRGNHVLTNPSCHGAYDPDDPGNSRLMFGGPDGTSFWKILSELDLTNCRAVLLGACESGLARCKVDAEYMGFPGAFHSAGADHVLGSLWKVNQLATAILLDRYFDALAIEQVSRPEALRNSQLDLMRMERDEVLAWVINNCQRMPASLRDDVCKGVGKLDSLPFAHPQWWAGFFLSGP
jgi:CHAT domain-containing protein/tetratricopeptide (TPR) repeat protein